MGVPEGGVAGGGVARGATCCCVVEDKLARVAFVFVVGSRGFYLAVISQVVVLVYNVEEPRGALRLDLPSGRCRAHNVLSLRLTSPRPLGILHHHPRLMVLLQTVNGRLVVIVHSHLVGKALQLQGLHLEVKLRTH